jgi:hypothetical protein
MAIFTRTRTATSSGTLAIIVLVLAFGNQAYTEWAARHAQGENAWDLFLRTLAWPSWGFSGSNVLSRDLRALLLILLVAAVIAAAAPGVAAGAGAFFIGWFAVIFGAGIAALLTAFLVKDASLYGALLSAIGAAGYGLVVGWIVGIATSAGRRAAG